MKQIFISLLLLFSSLQNEAQTNPWVWSTLDNTGIIDFRSGLPTVIRQNPTTSEYYFYNNNNELMFRFYDFELINYKGRVIYTFSDFSSEFTGYLQHIKFKNKYLFFNNQTSIYIVDVDTINCDAKVKRVGNKSEYFSDWYFPHSNGEDWWLCTFNDDNTYDTYLFTGLDLVKKKTYKTPLLNGIEYLGYGILSHFAADENENAFYISLNDKITKLGYDTNTGELVFKSDFYFNKSVSVEVSPNSKWLYVTTTDSLFQYSLQDFENKELFAKSKTLVARLTEFNGFFSWIRKAMNGKIYLCSNFSNFWSAIENPNEAAPFCKYVSKVIEFKYPVLLQSSPFLLTNNFHISITNECSGVFGFSFSGRNVSTLMWSFGDGSSSSEKTPNHSYNSKGIYTVSLKYINSSGQQQTISKDISVYALPTKPVVRVLTN